MAVKILRPAPENAGARRASAIEGAELVILREGGDCTEKWQSYTLNKPLMYLRGQTYTLTLMSLHTSYTHKERS
jgi:hypothetical protein